MTTTRPNGDDCGEHSARERTTTIQPAAGSYLDSESFAALPFGIAVVSLIASIVTSDWQWFARSGSLLAVAGLIMMSRSTLRRSIWVDVRLRSEQVRLRDEKESSNDAFFGKMGIAYTFAGTVVWGYGDLLGVLLRKLGA